MANLAIKGHATRGKEVIEILEMLGGKNIHNCDGTFNECYAIDNNKICTIYTSVAEIDNCTIFTLEEFLEKYPYKVGDKVLYKHENKTYFIKKCFWENDKILYELSDEVYSDGCSLPDTLIFDVDVVKLQPNKEETMEESTNKVIFGIKAQSCDIMIKVTKKDIKEIKINIPEDYKVFRIDDGNKIVVTKKQPQYPKTYEECCKVLGYSGNYNMILTTDLDCKLFNALYRIKVCRDAYWKIAGEEMRLGKPWEPDWSSGLNKCCLLNCENRIIKSTLASANAILAFPTEKMRDAFYDNFKDLIDSCKELL